MFEDLRQPPETTSFTSGFSSIVMQRPEGLIPGASPRRGRHLTPIQTSFDDRPSRKLYRPRPVETVIYEKPAGRVPLAPSTLAIEHRDSRIGLRSLFGRSRSTPTVKTENDSPSHAKTMSFLEDRIRTRRCCQGTRLCRTRPAYQIQPL